MKQNICRFILVIFCIVNCSILGVLTTQDSKMNTDYSLIPLQSVVPSFIQEVTTSEPVISPLDQNGIKDSAQFSFQPTIDSYYNFTVEKDTTLLDDGAVFTSITSDDSVLYMMTQDRTSNTYSIPGGYGNRYPILFYMQNSTDNGKTWSSKVETNLTISGYASMSNYYIYNPDLVYNASDNSMILMLEQKGGLDSGFTLYFYKSFDQVHWEFLGKLADQYIGTSSLESCQADMILSSNQTEILVSIANYGTGYVYFFKSRDCAGSWVDSASFSVGSNGPRFPTIVMSPTSSKITMFWFKNTPQQYFYTFSTDFGATWSVVSTLGVAQGFGSIKLGSGYADGYYEFAALSRQMVLSYNAGGQLHGCVIVNGSFLYQINSTTDGTTWDCYEELRDFGVFHPFSLSFYRSTSNQDYYAFTGDMQTGKSVSIYFLNPSVQLLESPVSPISGSVTQTTLWDGKNLTGNFVDDGNYIARIWLTDETTGIRNNESSFIRIRVDNTVVSPLITQLNSYFSPPPEYSWYTDYSPGINDTTILSFNAIEDVYYDTYYQLESSYVQTQTVKITNSELRDTHGDVAMDNDDTLWCVYVSYENGDQDLYLKKSTNFGATWGLSEMLVGGSTIDETPSILNHNDEIYITFLRKRPGLLSPNIVYDLFLIRSMDHGNSWTTPVNVTMGEFAVSGKNYYSCPEMVYAQNQLILGYYVWNSALNLYEWQIIKSIDIGVTFSSPIKVCTPPYSMGYGHSMGLAYDPISNILMATGINLIESYPGSGTYYRYPSIFTSTDLGITWLNTANITNPVNYYEFPDGVTLECLGENTFQIGFNYWNDYYDDNYICVSKTYDGGLTWSTTTSTYLLDHDQESSYDYYCGLRSGKSSQGDVFYIWTKTSNSNTDSYLMYYGNTILHETGLATIGQHVDLTWDGNNFWGAQASDGNYSISVVFHDLVGNTVENKFNCTLDNTLVPLSINFVNSGQYTPRIAQNFSCSSNGLIDANVYLYYRYSINEGWSRTLTIIMAEEYNLFTYWAYIPANLTATDVYFYFSGTDISGNTITTAVNTYYEPTLGFTIQALSSILMQTAWDPFEMELDVNSGSNYLNYLFVRYTLNDITHTVNLTADTSTTYILSPITLGVYVDSINYELCCKFTNGITKSLYNITLASPKFTYNPEDFRISFSSADPERKLDGQITIQISNIPSKYVDKLYLDYKLNDAATFSSVEMILTNGTTYVGTITGNQQTFSLQYRIRIKAADEKEVELVAVTGSSALQQEYIPSFPTVELLWPNQLYAALISAGVGMMFSVSYLTNKRKSTKRIQERFIHTLRLQTGQVSGELDNLILVMKEKKAGSSEQGKNATTSDGTTPAIKPSNVTFDLQTKTNSKMERGSGIYLLGTFFSFVFLAGGVLLSFIMSDGVWAMLVTAAGLLIAAFTLVERVLIDITRGVYSRKEFHYTATLLHTILVASMIIAFMFAGTKVEWFNYYVIKETFDLGGLAIPRLWFSLFSVFITSIVLLIVTSYRELKNSMKRFAILEQTNENWKVIWQNKEETVSKLNSNVGMKTLIFIATVSFTVISTTKLSRYTEVGMILLVPFLIVVLLAAVMDMAFSSQVPTAKEALKNWIVEPTKPCAKCGGTNLFTNVHCTHCNEPFAGNTTIVEKTIECPKCKNLSPVDAKYCRACGNGLVNTPSGTPFWQK